MISNADIFLSSSDTFFIDPKIFLVASLSRLGSKSVEERENGIYTYLFECVFILYSSLNQKYVEIMFLGCNGRECTVVNY